MNKKWIGILFLTICLFGVTGESCFAKSNILNDIIKVVSAGGAAGHSSRHNVDPAPQRIMLNLDGNYSYVHFDKSVFKKSSCVTEHYFKLDRPAKVDLHYIGHTKRYYGIRVYDSDLNQLGQYTSVLDGAGDKSLMLKPGEYAIKTTVDGNNGQNKIDIDFEIKGTKKDIKSTVQADNYTRRDAVPLFIGAETVDYFPAYSKNEPDKKYYKIILHEARELKIIIDKLTEPCGVYFELLDEDERILDYLSNFYDNHFQISKQLDAGVYYIKAKRSNISDDDGSVFAISIE